MDHPTCSICYEELSAATGTVQMAGCGHGFHFRCIATWFSRQGADRASQTCPCCRQQPTELGRLPDIPEEDEDMDAVISDDSETMSYTEEVPIEVAAARERAAHRFAVLRATLTEEALQSYAATRIAAAFRGSTVRTNLWMARDYYPRKVQATFTHLCGQLRGLNELRQELRRDKRDRAAWTQRAMLGRQKFNHLTACKIQTWWRDLLRRRGSVNDRADAFILKKHGETLWRRLDEYRWRRFVKNKTAQLNPEEDDVVEEVFDRVFDDLPPQSLAFEMAYSVTKIQSVWRGCATRRQVAQMRRN
jgi:hypothetical protein